MRMQAETPSQASGAKVQSQGSFLPSHLPTVAASKSEGRVSFFHSRWEDRVYQLRGKAFAFNREYPVRSEKQMTCTA